MEHIGCRPARASAGRDLVAQSAGHAGCDRRRGVGERAAEADDVDAVEALLRRPTGLVGHDRPHAVASLDETACEVAHVVLDASEVRRVVLVEHRHAHRARATSHRTPVTRVRPSASNSSTIAFVEGSA